MASNFGLSDDVLGGLIGGLGATALKLDQIQADIARLRETVSQGFQDTNANNFYRQIQQASQESQAAHLALSNRASDVIQDVRVNCDPWSLFTISCLPTA